MLCSIIVVTCFVDFLMRRTLYVLPSVRHQAPPSGLRQFSRQSEIGIDGAKSAAENTVRTAILAGYWPHLTLRGKLRGVGRALQQRAKKRGWIPWLSYRQRPLDGSMCCVNSVLQTALTPTEPMGTYRVLKRTFPTR